MRSLAAVLVASLALSCQKPQPPTLTVKDAKVRSLDPSGMGVDVRVDATNPNRFALAVQSVDGHVTLLGRDAGTVALGQPLTLAPGATKGLVVPVTMRWSDVGGLAMVVASGRDIPYELDGTATIGGESLRVTLPFHVKGVVTSREIATFAQRAIAPGIPLNLPFK